MLENTFLLYLIATIYSYYIRRVPKNIRGTFFLRNALMYSVHCTCIYRLIAQSDSSKCVTHRLTRESMISISENFSATYEDHKFLDSGNYVIVLRRSIVYIS